MWRVLTTLPQLFQLRKRAPQREAAAFRFSRELA
jgi:hypothetical protein